MNARRRKTLRRAVMHLETASLIMRDITDNEQDSLDNMPENLSGGIRYEEMEEGIEVLEDSVERIDDTINDLTERFL